MKLLILGGTVFLGRHIVQAALERGHEVTLFHRGKHNPELFPEVEKLKGDRNTDLSSLKGRSWDAVIDTCGYVPRIVKASAQLLSDSVGLYVFISTLSVYADLSVRGLDESSPVGKLDDETVEEVTGETYGPLKALCEQAVEESFPDRAFIPRPGLIVGPHDPTDRFTYWPVRISRGGKVLAPEPKNLDVMYIDVRDLADWIIRMSEENRTGIYNADGPNYVLTMEHLLSECNRVSGGDAELVWVDAGFLLEQKVQPWTDMPLWLPGGETAGMGSFKIDKALSAGLKFRPLKETIAATLGWHKTQATEAPLKTGITPERERALLEIWRRRSLSR